MTAPQGGDTGAAAPIGRGRAARFPTLPFIWVALVLGLGGGFGLGAALLLLPLLGVPAERWLAAGVQAHAHAQLVGWGGCMALGVGLHVLPRLRGAPLAGARLQPWALSLLAGGLTLRLVGGPAAAVMIGTPAARPLAWLGLGLGSVLELAGAGIAVGLLAVTHRRGPPVAERPGLAQVLPLLLAAFGMLLATLALQAGLGLAAALAGTAVLAGAGEAAMVELGLLGFLVVMSVAISARFFPLYLRVLPAAPAGLRLTLGLLLAGLAGRLLAPALPGIRAAGDLLVGLGLLTAVAVLFGEAAAAGARPVGPAAWPRWWLPRGLVRRPSPPPGRARPARPADRAARRLIRSAYGWLLLAAGLALTAGIGGPFGWAPPADLERHALGAGFVTLLILGMGALLLPGFVGGQAPAGPVVASLWLGNLAAALRVLPGLAGWLAPTLLPAPLRAGLMGMAGLAGLAAVICLGLIVGSALRWDRRSPDADGRREAAGV